MDEDLLKLKSFLLLVNSYLEKFLKENSLDKIVDQLDSEIFIYEYDKNSKTSDLKNYTGFIVKDEDIEENFYALSYAAYRYLNTKQTGNKIIDEYILKMLKK